MELFHPCIERNLDSKPGKEMPDFQRKAKSLANFMNTQKKSLTLNFLMNAILTMSQFLFPLLTFPYISRILLPTGTGKVSFATSVVSYFALFAQLGIPTYGIRACAKVRDDKEALTRTVQELFLINLVMSIIAYVALFGAIVFVPRLQQEKE